MYGSLAEFSRETGSTRIGGSMHAFFPPFGIYPNNAIVGDSGDIGVVRRSSSSESKPGIVIVNIGDASSSCGRSGKALFANMDQFKTLWDEAHRAGCR